MSMAHSLEARVPILDYRIVELAMQMPEEYKVTFFKTKRILKHLCSTVPTKIDCQRQKEGIDLSNSSMAVFADFKRPDPRCTAGIIDELFVPQQVSLLLKEHFTRQKDNSRILWALLTSQVWHQNYVSQQLALNVYFNCVSTHPAAWVYPNDTINIFRLYAIVAIAVQL